jgi:hypothetical protein
MRPMIRQPGPRLPGVRRLPDAAAGTAAVEAPGRAAALIRRAVQDVRVDRVHDDVGEARVLVDELRERPVGAAVRRLVEAALLVRSEQVPDRGDVEDIRVLRMDDDARDALCLLQPHLLPRLAGVGGLVDAGAERGALAVVRFARADIHDVRIRRCDRDVADRRDRLLVEHGRERRPVVDGLPHATGRERDVVDVGIALDHGEVIDAPDHVGGADGSPREVLEDRIGALMDGWRRRRGGLPEALRLHPARAERAQSHRHQSRPETERLFRHT